MKFYLFTVVFCISIFVFINHISASPISVPMDHWSYQFIERLQAKGILKDYLSNSKPYTRDEVAEMIFHTSKLLEEGSIKLSKTQKAQLDELKREFAQELNELGMSGIDEYKHLLNWSDGNEKLTVDAGYIQDATVKIGDEDYQIYNSTLEFAFRGDIKKGFFISSDIKNSRVKSNEPRPLWQPYFSRYPYESVANAYMTFKLPWIDLQFGRDAILWGPGYDGVVGLSGVDPAFDLIKLPIKIWKVKFVGLIGFPRDNIGLKYQSDIVRKNLSAHRYEIDLFPGICVGWQEAYVYAGNLQLAFINPLMPYQVAEDYFGDVGNNTMEGDIDVCLIPNTRLYSSLFLDDFHTDMNPFTDAGFRWAALGGFLIVDPFGLDDFDFRVEYTRVEPWVYPHKGIVQDPPVPTSYTNSDSPLGHWIGPNADDLLFEINYYFTKDLQTTISYKRVREGELGGNIYEYDFDIVQYGKKDFLGGVVEGTHTINFGLKYRIFQDSTFKIDYSYIYIHNKQSEEAKLPNMQRYEKPIWVAGNNWSQNVLKASLTLKY
jgi:hypothetical protein